MSLLVMMASTLTPSASPTTASAMSPQTLVEVTMRRSPSPLPLPLALVSSPAQAARARVSPVAPARAAMVRKRFFVMALIVAPY